MQNESPTEVPVPGQANAGPALAVPAPDGGPQHRLGARVPLRILAADDVRTNRELIRQLAGHFGYEVELVDNGAEVLAALSRRSFDLILLDVQMPVMDGLEAAREIVRLNPDPGQRPKMVALTANSLVADREACLAAGMDDCLAKPPSPKTMEACIARLFTGAPPASAPRALPNAPTKLIGPPLIDIPYLEAAIPGQSDPQRAAILRRMHRAVSGDFEKIWPRVVDAGSRQDQNQLGESLHALKGCFAVVGWSRLTSRCSKALDQARARRFAEWTTLPDELQWLYAASTAELIRYLAVLDSNGSSAPPAKDSARTDR
jgi:CheY-like chemotaxis protein